MSHELELLTVGRVGVDFYAEEPNAGFVDARTFQKSVGGSPTNVAVAAARLGRRSAVFTKVGDDGLGEYVRHALGEEFGVDPRFVGTHPSLKTPIVVAVMDPPEEPQFVFYREPQAPDATLTIDEVDLDVARDVPILWISAGALAEEPSRGTVRALLAGAQRRRHTVLDLDYRPSFWASEDDARARSARPSTPSLPRSATASSARSRSAPTIPTAPPTRCWGVASSSPSSSWEATESS